MTNFSSPAWQKVFDKILFDLQTKSCVLLVGPELVQADGQGLLQQMHSHVLHQNATDIERFYEKEGLFLFKSEAAKNEVRRSASQFFFSLKPASDVFKVVAQIPFPLVISVNPDRLLEKAYGNAPHFAAFFNHHANANGHQDTEGWDGQAPLVYSLCGRFDEDASMLLDYDDLFSFLKTVLSPTGLPDNLRSRLRRAKSFLFVGFHFDHWYTQLLLRLINEGNSPSHLALNTQLGDPEAQHFLLNRYKMKFLGRVAADDLAPAEPPPPAESAQPAGQPTPPAEEKLDCTGQEFLEELLQRWLASKAEQDQDDEPVSAASVRRMVERGELGKALKALPDLLSDPEDRDMTTMLSNWHANWEREKKRDVEDSRTLENRYNKVLNGIIEQLNSL